MISVSKKKLNFDYVLTCEEDTFNKYTYVYVP